MKTSFGLSVALMLMSTAALADELQVAPITAVQVDAIRIAFPTNLKNKPLAASIQEASPTIAEFMKVESCLAGFNGSPLNKFAAPGKVYYGFNEPSPMTETRSHSKNACLTVNKIYGFGMPTKNTLAFEVVFAAEDSGEVTKRRYAMQKQDDGSWLFK